MKKILFIGLPIAIVIGLIIGYFLFIRQKVGVNLVTPTCPAGQHFEVKRNADGDIISAKCVANAVTPTPAPTVAGPLSCPAGQHPEVKRNADGDIISAKCVANAVTPTPSPSQGCTQCSGGTACNACSAAPNQGYRCNCSGSLGGNYATCTGALDSACGSATGPTPTPLSACSRRYYFDTNVATCSSTTRYYSDTSGIDCNGQTGKTCEDNLADWLSGKTTGTCYASRTECTLANCSLRYYFNTTTSLCGTTTRYYSSKDIDCDGQTGKTCAANLSDWLQGTTTGVCYPTKVDCASKNCTLRYYYDKTLKSCKSTLSITDSQYFNAADKNCQSTAGELCTSVLATKLTGKTGGVCYTVEAECNTANASSPLPSTDRPLASTFTEITATASTTPTPTPSSGAYTADTSTTTPSPRAGLPDTSDGTPVTGVFEVTTGTIGMGLLLLLGGLLGLLLI